MSSDAIPDCAAHPWPAPSPVAQSPPEEERAAAAGRPAPPPGPPRERLSPADVAGLTVSLALVAGLVESFNFALRAYVWGEMMHVTPDLPWMAPVTLLALFAVPGAIVAALGARMPRRQAFGWAMMVLGTFFWFNLLLRGPAIALPARLLLAAGLAVMTKRVLEPRIGAFLRLARHVAIWSAGVVLVTAAVMVGGRWWGERRALASLPPASPDAPNVLLIVLDTVRADAWGIDVRARAPSCFHEWAEQGAAFEMAIAPSPWTLPSHASMFTGLSAGETKADWSRPLAERFHTLAEELASHGYATAGFAANSHYCSRATGLAQGFSRYEDFGFTLADFVWSTAVGRRFYRSRLRPMLGYHELRPRKSAEQINTDVLDWLSSRSRRPCFVFVNYFDPHHPYLAPEPFDEHHPRSAEEGVVFRDWWWLDKLALEPETISQARLAYRDCVDYLDQQMGRLLAELNRRGELDNTLLIITSDHGEHFGEHDLYIHGNSLYQPVAHVPLAIIWPGRIPAGRRVASPVATQDLAATIVDLLGLESESTLPGQSLARWWETETRQEPTAGRPVCSEIVHASTTPPDLGNSPVSRGPMKCVLIGSFKLIRNGDGVEELYDLAGDPQERVNLVEDEQYQAVLDECRAALAETDSP